MIYLNLRYSFTGIVILASIATRRLSIDLNIKVRDLRHIHLSGPIMKNSLKNFAGAAFGAYAAGQGAFES